MDAAVSIAAYRTPIGSFGGALKDLTAPQLGAVVVREAVARAGAASADALLHALDRQRGSFGVASLCVEGGMGFAMVVERVVSA